MSGVTWRLATDDVDVASVRYRCLVPLRVLEAEGVAHGLSWGRQDPLLDAPDTLVFIKAFTQRDVEHAVRAAANGVRVVLDMCDNVFARDDILAQERVRRLAAVAACVVTTGPALAGVLRHELQRDDIVEIPDPVESPADVRWAANRLWGARLRLTGERPALAARSSLRGLSGEIRVTRGHTGRRGVARPELPHVLWFGHAGILRPRYGLVSIADIGQQLESAARQTPFELRVVTSSRPMYERLVAPLDVKSRFVRWDRYTVGAELRRRPVVIVPNSRDAFSICKSANRTVAALAHGAPVVATSVPALEPLDDCVTFDDFSDGITRYLTNESLRARHIARADGILQEIYSPAVVARAWADALTGTPAFPLLAAAA